MKILISTDIVPIQKCLASFRQLFERKNSTFSRQNLDARWQTLSIPLVCSFPGNSIIFLVRIFRTNFCAPMAPMRLLGPVKLFDRDNCRMSQRDQRRF
jgi:hypothetical protein